MAKERGLPDATPSFDSTEKPVFGLDDTPQFS
jgi:hypothetical protein